MSNLLLRLCDSCIFYNAETSTCKAFPEGVPLTSEETHFEVHPDQEGTTTYILDEGLFDYLDMFKRIHPEVKFPVVLSQETEPVEE